MDRSAADLLAEVDTLPDEWALASLDRALARGEVTQPQLIKCAAAWSDRVQWLVAVADARATSTAESMIRRAWYAANLRTPSVGRRFLTPHGMLTAVCATEYHRFAVAIDATEEQCAWLAQVGWRVLMVSEQKVLAAAMLDLAEHLRAEHLHHLSTVGVDRHQHATSS